MQVQRSYFCPSDYEEIYYNQCSFGIYYDLVALLALLLGFDLSYIFNFSIRNCILSQELLTALADLGLADILFALI